MLQSAYLCVKCDHICDQHLHTYPIVWRFTSTCIYCAYVRIPILCIIDALWRVLRTSSACAGCCYVRSTNSCELLEKLSIANFSKWRSHRAITWAWLRHFHLEGSTDGARHCLSQSLLPLDCERVVGMASQVTQQRASTSRVPMAMATAPNRRGKDGGEDKDKTVHGVHGAQRMPRHAVNLKRVTLLRSTLKPPNDAIALTKWSMPDFYGSPKNHDYWDYYAHTL